MTNEVRHIPLKDIRLPFKQMRLVDRDSQEYLELRESIQRDGITQSLSVRDNGDGSYDLIAGAHRHAVATDLNLETLPCIIVPVTDNIHFVTLQLQENAVRKAPERVEYARLLNWLLEHDADLTVRKLATKVCKSESWVKQILQLRNLSVESENLVNAGHISASAAYQLSRFPHDLQREALQHAVLMPEKEFIDWVRPKIKSFLERARGGRGKIDFQFEPVKKPRQVMAINQMLRDYDAAKAVLEAEGSKTLVEAFFASLKWCLQIDKISIEERRNDYLTLIASQTDGGKTPNVKDTITDEHAPLE